MKTEIISLPNQKEASKKTKLDYNNLKVMLPSSFLMDWGKNKKFCIRTYGCQANVRDSEIIRNYLLDIGMTEQDDFSGADFVLFNTCAVRENAENHLYGELGLCKNSYLKNKDMIIAVCGCVVQEDEATKFSRDHIKHVRLILGTSRRNSCYSILEDSIKSNKRIVNVSSNDFDVYEEPIGSKDSRLSTIKAFVNIMYGCDKYCTYCIVPYTRGRERSRKEEDIINEVLKLKELGYKEVTLLGQNVDAYGKDRGEKYGIERIRFTTPYPSDFNSEVFDVMSKYKNIMPSIHMPLQSGSNNILKKMNRRYTREEYLEVIKSLREKIPHVYITTDIIVGFPNESDQDFEDTLSLVNEVKYDAAFTFIYSKRPGTPASKLIDHISDETKHARFDRLKILVDSLTTLSASKFVNRECKVLFDTVSKKDKTMISGYTEEGKLVHVKGDSSLLGQIKTVKILNSHTFSLIGEVIDE